MTSCNISVKEKKSNFQSIVTIYKHCDGNFKGVGLDIKNKFD